MYEHSKKLLGNLIVLLACRDDYKAACEARLAQYDMFMHCSSLVSSHEEELERYNSVSSVTAGKCEPNGSGESTTTLAHRVRELIKFVSLR